MTCARLGVVRFLALLIALAIPLSAEARLTPECKAGLAKADALAKKGNNDEARAALDGLEKSDPPEGGECTVRVLQRRGDLSDDPRLKAKLYRQAAHRATDQIALWRTLTQARIAAEKKAQHPKDAKRLGELLALERDLRGPKADQAIAAFTRDKDPLRAQWATAMKAKMLAASGDVAGARALAEPLIVEKRSPFVRLAAQEALTQAAIVAKDPEGEARAALVVDALRAELAGKTPDERRFTRSPAADKACQRYERTAGDGRCAQLAKQLTGDYSFTDFSRGKPKKTVSREQLEQAQKQYSFAIEGCVREAASRNADGELFENATFKIGWSVRPDGRAADVEIEPRRYDPVLGACVKERVAWFRYPRATDGQVQNISIPYALSVTEKYGGSH